MKNSLIILAILLSATLHGKENKFVFWGMSTKNLIKFEEQRLGKKPKILAQKKRAVKQLRYKHNNFDSSCYLTYQLFKERLISYYYICANDQWQGKDFEKNMVERLSQRYGKKTIEKAAGKSWLKWKFKNSHIYLQTKMIKQKNIAKITFSRLPLKPLLKSK